MSVKKTEYCICGSSIAIIATSRVGANRAIAAWREAHQGHGHGPATRQAAAQQAQEVKSETVAQSVAGLDV